jgi:hypothetical protein
MSYLIRAPYSLGEATLEEQDFHDLTDDPFDSESYEVDVSSDDPKLPEAIDAVRQLLYGNPKKLFYEKQIEILLEKKIFHWITTKALRVLRESGEIRSELENLYPPSLSSSEGVLKNHIRFYFDKRNRYVKRQAEQIKALVRQFTDQKFTHALGTQGELLVDAGLPRMGFMPIAQNVRSHNDRIWTATNHNLDRIFVRDGLAYGVEIKNRLQYIASDEWKLKLRMCLNLRLIPLFIARMMPSSYIYDTMKAGGFSLIMGRQFYPITHEHLARTVREQLNLPVDCPIRLADGTIQRLLNFHQEKLKRFAAQRPS